MDFIDSLLAFDRDDVLNVTQLFVTLTQFKIFVFHLHLPLQLLSHVLSLLLKPLLLLGFFFSPLLVIILDCVVPFSAGHAHDFAMVCCS